MKYNELISFDPVETVVQLRDANKAESAKNLIKSYVISDEMSDRLINIVIPHMQFDYPNDNKGLFVVGNYGTGKSHLMSVVSSIAEDAQLSEFISSSTVFDASKCIAGKFKVLRTEIGAVQRPLREIIIDELERFLAKLEVDYTFPSLTEINNHKNVFMEMESRFLEKYPDKGILIVVDELLDYLRTRKEQELMLDLNFLREIGEYSKDSRFRFIAGIQEAIFDSHMFAFVAQSIKRVQARFEQVSIARNDVKYVVAERLLKKTADQQAKIREYLSPFAKYYGNMNERMEEFVRLFPVHPDYIETFEKVTVVEKREVLKSLSQSMRSILDKELPTDVPGLIAYDSYWNILKQNAANRTDQTIKEVIDCSTVIENKINTSITRKQYKDMAIRLIHALSVHRLTVGDIYSSIGASAAELRDCLALYEPMLAEMGSSDPEKDLETHVETVLREVHKTVSGQFLSINKENGQYYLDLKKIDDYDALIAKRAETLGDSKLDTYYYEALKRAMECQDITPHVSGYRIWQHELEWIEKMSGRTGYLFFGAPDERSTATPQRDFYLYFVQIYEQSSKLSSFINQKRSDEVFFKLNNTDDDFKNALKYYAAAIDLSSTSSGHAKTIYLSKAGDFLKEITNWLRNNMRTAYEVTYQGKTKTITEWVKGTDIRSRVNLSPNQVVTFKDMINTISGICLSPHFTDQAPEYPAFSVMVREDNRKQYAIDCLRAIAGNAKTKSAIAVLDALELLDGEKIDTANSRYAKHIRDLLKAKGHGQVLNRNEIFTNFNGLEYMCPETYRLEPELVLILIASLIYSGEIVLAIPGQKFDATELKLLSSKSINELENFKHIEQPKDWNIAGLKALVESLGEPAGAVTLITQGNDTPIISIQNKISDLLKKLVMADQTLKEGISFLGTDILVSLDAGIKSSINNAKVFYESLQVFNSPGKLKNFKHDPEDIMHHAEALKYLGLIENLKSFATSNSTISTWVAQAEDVLPVNDDWTDRVKATKADIRKILEEEDIESLLKKSAEITSRLIAIKDEYIKKYSLLHSKARLSSTDDKRKAALLNDSRFDTLRKLSGIDIMPVKDMRDLQEKLTSLKSCFSLTEDDLRKNPKCPHCGFRPSSGDAGANANSILDYIDNELDKTVAKWTDDILANLADPVTKSNVDLLKHDDKLIIEEFMNKKELPEVIDNDFISALKQLFSGLIKVEVSIEEVKKALKTLDGPSGAAEIKKCFGEYIDNITRGKDQNKVRIVID